MADRTASMVERNSWRDEGSAARLGRSELYIFEIPFLLGHGISG